jgi:hypothetical protein
MAGLIEAVAWVPGNVFDKLGDGAAMVLDRQILHRRKLLSTGIDSQGCLRNVF